jgi:hypothetical protein
MSTTGILTVKVDGRDDETIKLRPLELLRIVATRCNLTDVDAEPLGDGRWKVQASGNLRSVSVSAESQQAACDKLIGQLLEPCQ